MRIIVRLIAGHCTGPGRKVRLGPAQGKEDREEDEAMPHPKQDGEEEDLEEGQEEVGVTGEEEDEGDEGGHSSIEDGRAHVHLGENE